MGKRKVQDDETETKPKARASAKKQAPTEPYTGDDGWTIHPPSLIYKNGEVPPCDKIAAFDLDGTLAVVKSTAQFPRDEHDWKLFNPKVPKGVQKLAQEGFKIVVFSNQGGIKSALEGKMAEKLKKRTDHILEKLEVPAQVFLATGNDEFRKPGIGMWEFMVANCNGGVLPDKKSSFFVGDAAGRLGDIADSDKAFATKIGIGFKTPEEVFGEGVAKKAMPPASEAEGGAPDIPENKALADAFRQLAEEAERKGGNSIFQARAYTKVAGVIDAYPQRIRSGKELEKIKGVGKASVAKIDEFLATGTLASLERKEDAAEPEVAAPQAVGKEAPPDAKKPKKEDMALNFL